MKKQTKADKMLDKQIESLYYRHGNGKSINIMDIGKLFAYAKVKAADLGIEAAVIEAIKLYCKE